MSSSFVKAIKAMKLAAATHAMPVYFTHPAGMLSAVACQSNPVWQQLAQQFTPKPSNVLQLPQTQATQQTAIKAQQANQQQSQRLQLEELRKLTLGEPSNVLKLM